MSRVSSLPGALLRMSLYGWLYGLLSLMFIGISLWYAAFAWDVARTHYVGGVAGTVVVDDCQWTERANGGWDCSGEFVSDDGQVRVPEVALRPYQPQWPEEPVATRVSGPEAGEAWIPSSGEWIRIAALGVFAYMAFWTSRRAVVTALAEQDERRRRAPERQRPPERLRPPLAPPRQRLSHAPPPGQRPAEEPPEVAVRRPRREARDAPPARGVGRLPVVLAAYLALVLATAAVIWSTVQWNREQDALWSAHATAEVVATGLGADDRIEVHWTDHTGQGWLTRFTPWDAGAYAAGDLLDLRYDPARPADPVPADRDGFDLPVRDRNVWTGLLLAPGLLLAWAWTWRLGRWATGALRRGRPMHAEVLVSQLKWAGEPLPVPVGGRTHLVAATEEPMAYWLRLHDPSGRTWHQRVVWHHRLADVAAASISAGGVSGALARPCPGLRRMFLVDMPGVGRLWPASTARRRPPRNYWLVPFDPRRLGETHRAGWVAKVLGIGAFGALAAVLWRVSGPAGAAYAPLLLISYWCWAGATPWHGLYASRGARTRNPDRSGNGTGPAAGYSQRIP